MRVVTRCAYLLLIVAALIVMGCSKNSTNPPLPPPPDTHAPVVSLSTAPEDTILYHESAIFSWSGSDPDGNLSHYMVGLNGNFVNLAGNTTATFNAELQPLTGYTFKVFAVDLTDLHSDTISYTFFVNHLRPLVTLISTPQPYIHTSISPAFSWQGSAPNSVITGYYIGFHGNLSWTTETSVTYGPMPAQNNIRFQVLAENYEGLQSDTVSFLFNVVTNTIVLAAEGQGLVDADNDGFWTKFNVRWIPWVTVLNNPMTVRMVYGIRPAFSPGIEILDSTELVTRQYGQMEFLHDTLPVFPHGYYDIRAELHGTDGSTLWTIPYNTVVSLNNVGLEDIDEAYVWITSVDTANRVDLEAPFGYYESIDLLVDVDSYGDPVHVRIILYERTSAEQLNDQEHILSDYTTTIEGTGYELNGWHIIAQTAQMDVYDYRIEVRDQYSNALLAQRPYSNPLMDIPLADTTPTLSSQPTRATPLRR
jgi:hypothetical protein